MNAPNTLLQCHFETTAAYVLRPAETLGAHMSEHKKLLDEKLVLSLWPETGEILGLSRGATYEAAKRGDIRTLDVGRLKKVPAAWLRQKLGLEPAA